MKEQTAIPANDHSEWIFVIDSEKDEPEQARKEDTGFDVFWVSFVWSCQA